MHNDSGIRVPLTPFRNRTAPPANRNVLKTADRTGGAAKLPPHADKASDRVGFFPLGSPVKTDLQIAKGGSPPARNSIPCGRVDDENANPTIGAGLSWALSSLVGPTVEPLAPRRTRRRASRSEPAAQTPVRGRAVSENPTPSRGTAVGVRAPFSTPKAAADSNETDGLPHHLTCDPLHLFDLDAAGLPPTSSDNFDEILAGIDAAAAVCESMTPRGVPLSPVGPAEVSLTSEL